MQEVLEHIQADVPKSSPDLPPELALTSQTLLSSLPSSNHFLLLPSNVRSYKPYVDGSSLSTSGPSGPFRRKIDDWFQNALQQARHALEIWFADLRSIHDVWKIRKWAMTWIYAAAGLQAQERTALSAALDAACQQRATSVWKAALSSAATVFRERMAASLSELKAGDFGMYTAHASGRSLH